MGRMQQLFIPTIGQPLRLASDWTFTLYAEGRNETVWKALNPEWKNGQYGWWWGENDEDGLMKRIEVTLPAGTLLQVDRIYIRKGNDAFSAFDSLTFFIKETSHPSLQKGRLRFWAKLYDVNMMNIEVEDMKESILKGIVNANKDDIPKLIRQMQDARFEVIKTMDASSEIVALAPRKRWEDFFQGKLKKLKRTGWKWTDNPWRYERGHNTVKAIVITEPE